MMDNYKELINHLKHDYHGVRTVEANPDIAFHDLAACLTAISTLTEENARLLDKLKSAQESHAFWMEEEMGVQKQLRAELEQARRELDAAVSCIYEIEDDLDRGNDNDWAREHIEEWRGPQKEE